MKNWKISQNSHTAHAPYLDCSNIRLCVGIRLYFLRILTVNCEHLFQIVDWSSLLFTANFAKNCIPIREGVTLCWFFGSEAGDLKMLQVRLPYWGYFHSLLSGFQAHHCNCSSGVKNFQSELHLHLVKQPCNLNSAANIQRISHKISSACKGSCSLEKIEVPLHSVVWRAWNLFSSILSVTVDGVGAGGYNLHFLHFKFWNLWTLSLDLKNLDISEP